MAPETGSADVVHLVVTEDGVRLALHRYRAHHRYRAQYRDRAEGERRSNPILCCHGLAANRLAFDVGAVSLAGHLARRGFEVFVLELRGHGLSERPRWGWSFDDYLERDLPAAFEAVLRRTGASRLHFIGHSMGGLLGYARLSSAAGRLASVTTVGSSLNYSAGSGFRSLLPLTGVLGRIPAVPVRAFARATAPFVGRWVTPYERFNVWPTNCDPALWRRVCTTGFHPVSAPVMAQLATALSPGGLRSADGKRNYFDSLSDLPGEARVPVLALAGSRDAQCPPEAAGATVARIPGAELVVCGRESGHHDHYGHWDLLIGRRVTDEVFPAIASFVERHDGRG